MWIIIVYHQQGKYWKKCPRKFHLHEDDTSLSNSAAASFKVMFFGSARAKPKDQYEAEPVAAVWWCAENGTGRFPPRFGVKFYGIYTPEIEHSYPK